MRRYYCIIQNKIMLKNQFKDCFDCGGDCPTNTIIIKHSGPLGNGIDDSRYLEEVDKLIKKSRLNKLERILNEEN